MAPSILLKLMGDSITNPTSHKPSHRGKPRQYLPTGHSRGVIGYILVSTVFFVVLVVVFTSLGTSIGAGLQELVDQLPLGL